MWSTYEAFRAAESHIYRHTSSRSSVWGSALGSLKFKSRTIGLILGITLLYRFLSLSLSPSPSRSCSSVHIAAIPSSHHPYLLFTTIYVVYILCVLVLALYMLSVSVRVAINMYKNGHGYIYYLYMHSRRLLAKHKQYVIMCLHLNKRINGSNRGIYGGPACGPGAAAKPVGGGVRRCWCEF